MFGQNTPVDHYFLMKADLRLAFLDEKFAHAFQTFLSEFLHLHYERVHDSKAFGGSVIDIKVLKIHLREES